MEEYRKKVMKDCDNAFNEKCREELKEKLKEKFRKKDR